MIVFFAITILCWAGIALLWWAWSRRKRSADLTRIQARLVGGPQADAKPAKSGSALIQKEDVSTGKLVMKLLQRFEVKERLRLSIEQAGLKWNVARTIHGCLALFLSAFTVCWYLEPDYRKVAPVAALIAGIVPLGYIARRRKSRLKAFEEQFPDVLEFLSRSMRAGHAFSVSLEMIYSEFREPVSGEFKRAFDEQNLGMPLDTALSKMSERVPSVDVQFFISAVVLQKRTGGNLAEVLDKLAHLIRERFKLRGRVKAISAHGKMTGMVLSLIPIGVGSLMCWINRDYADFFMHDESGQIMLGAAVVLQLVGYGIIRQIVNIEV